MDDDRNFTLKIITPDRVFYEEEVSMVEFNTVEGEVGVYKDHIPMTMIIAPGILTITKDGEVKEAALHAHQRTCSGNGHEQGRIVLEACGSQNRSCSEIGKAKKNKDTQRERRE